MSFRLCVKKKNCLGSVSSKKKKKVAEILKKKREGNKKRKEKKVGRLIFELEIEAFRGVFFWKENRGTNPLI